MDHCGKSKNIAESYGNAGSIIELEQKLSDIATECKTAKNRLLQTEKRMKSLMEILKYVEQYQSTLLYYTAYRKAKNPDVYFRKHESEIILHGGAKHMLEQSFIEIFEFGETGKGNFRTGSTEKRTFCGL